MKKILILPLLLGLSACDNTPKCWDEDIKNELLSNVTYTERDEDVNSATFGKKIIYKASRIEHIYELDKDKIDPHARCSIEISFENGKSYIFYYDTMWVKNENNSKEAKFINYNK